MVLLHREHGTPISGVAISAVGAGQTVSGDDGAFALSFPQGYLGQDVRLRVNVPARTWHARTRRSRTRGRQESNICASALARAAKGAQAAELRGLRSPGRGFVEHVADDEIGYEVDI